MNYEQESEEEKYADPEWNKILKNLSMDEEEQEEKEDPNEIENPEEIAREKDNKRNIIRTAQK